MKISLILGHPRPNSFCAALAGKVQESALAAGHEVRYHDLQTEGFDPLILGGETMRDTILPELVAWHCRELAEADGIVIVHPNWWGMPPAILKGWIDRVIRPGVAYEFLPGDKGEGVPRGLLKVRTALVLNTSDTEAEREERIFGDPLETIWRNCIFGLCGVTDVHRRIFRVVVTSTPEQRRRWLAESGELTARLFPADA